MKEMHKGVIFKKAHPLDEVVPGRWPEAAGYPGHGYERTVDQGMIIERDVEVELRDGTKIYIDLYRPDTDEAVPVLLSWNPYGKHSPQDMSKLPGTGVDCTKLSKYTTWEAPDPVWWSAQGYALILPDPRGVFHSDGDATFWNHAEAEDEYDLIEWAGIQGWSNGKVGLAGVSYLAVSQWLVASHQPPHLAAINPWEGFSDMYREVCFHGGIPETGFVPWWQEGVEFGLGQVEDLPATCAAHPLLDEHWKSKMTDFSKISVPAYVVASWSDQGLHTRGTLEAYKGLGSTDKWLEIHGRKKWGYYYQEDSLQRQLTFFDTYLKDKKTDIGDWPKVRYEVRDRSYVGDVHEDSSWPLPNTEYKRLYLNAGAARLQEQPAPQSAQVAYDCEAQDQDFAQFDFTFDQITSLVGHAKLHLFIEADGSDDADLFVSLEKIDKNGDQVDFPFFSIRDNGPVAMGWLRVSHRDLDQEKTTEHQPWHTHEREVPLQKGEVVPAEIEIWPSGTRFEAGETLRLVVSSSDRRKFPYMPFNRHAINRNKGRHIIHTGGQHSSYLLVPVLNK